jgi:hypothetical protein
MPLFIFYCIIFFYAPQGCGAFLLEKNDAFQVLYGDGENQCRELLSKARPGVYFPLPQVHSKKLPGKDHPGRYCEGGDGMQEQMLPYFQADPEDKRF